MSYNSYTIKFAKDFCEGVNRKFNGEGRMKDEIMLSIRKDIDKMLQIQNRPPISDFGLLQRIHPGHALTYLRTDRDEVGKRIGRVLGWDDGKMVAIREDGAAVEIHGS